MPDTRSEHYHPPIRPMPDTLTPQELAAIRESHQGRDDAGRLLAHIDALTAAVESSPIWHDFKAEGADPALVEDIRAAVLAILGED